MIYTMSDMGFVEKFLRDFPNKSVSYVKYAQKQALILSVHVVNDKKSYEIM